MKYKNILYSIKKDWKSIGIITLVSVLTSIFLSLIIPKTYKTHTELLVVQKQSNWAENAYISIQSAERVATILAKVVSSSSFMDRVMNSKFKIQDTFSKDPEERKEEWQDKVEVKTIKKNEVAKK